PCPWVRRTSTFSPRRPTASADARRPVRHARGSAPSLSRGAAGAPLPTAVAKRSEACPSGDVLSAFPYSLSFRFFLLRSLLTTTAVMPPVEVALAAITATVVRH